MPQLIPFTNDGDRSITITLGENMYVLETYYLPTIKRWLMDIYDTDENPILLGISLNVGVGNLVKGKAEIFKNQTLRCVSPTGEENDTPTSLGTTCFVYYYPEGEEPPVLYEDKMLA